MDKIQQPESDELRFFVRNQGKSSCLVISCNAQAPRIHLTVNRKQSPKTAPNLCMLLRKYLASANIAGVGVYNNDRILYVKFDAKTELKDDATYFLFVEIMNRYSNIVFTDESLTILDAVKHLPLDIARDHVVLRGVRYSPVGQKKISYLTDCNDVIDAYSGGDIHRYILDNISGFSGATVNELLLRAKVSEDNVTPQALGRLKDTIRTFAEGLDLSPCIINNEAYPVIYQSLAKSDRSNVTLYPTMSEAYDALYTDSDREIRNRARIKSLLTQAKHFRTRVEKNIVQDLERLKECENMEKYRIYGELVVNNIYLIKRGDATLKCVNYYDGKEVEIPLDPKLSPSKNSAAYYAKYNKLKRTKEFTEKKLASDRELLSYAQSIEEEIATLPYDASTAGIEEELASLGGGKKQTSKKVRNQAPEPPYVYEVDGFYIYRGKNNLQNDELTFRFASSSDIWLHIKNEHGAHVIIITENRPVPDKVLKIAAEIAAYPRQAGCDIDYTERRNVRRKPASHPGQVIYVNYKTLRVDPDFHSEFRIK